MVQITLMRPTIVDAIYLKADCGVRYWDDAEVNGEKDDEDNPRMPFASARLETWSVLIDIAAGTIVNWPAGTTASTHYKVCDAGRYSLLDAEKAELIAIDGYVPRMMCPKEHGYGDYVIMDIDANGQIVDWQFDPSAFVNDEDA